MAGGEFNPGYEPTSPEVFALAAAMALQAAKRRTIQGEMAAELHGELSARHSAAVHKAYFMEDIEVALVRITNPTAPIMLEVLGGIREGNRPATNLANLYENSAAASQNDVNQSPGSARPADASDTAPHAEAAQFARELDTARVMAAELGVSVVEIYKNDDFYIELGRRTTTLENIVNQVKLELKEVSPEALEASIRDSSTFGEFAGRISDSELRAIVADQSAQASELLRQTAMYKIAQLWANEGIASLMDEQLAIIHPKLPLFSGTLALLEIAHHQQAEGQEG